MTLALVLGGGAEVWKDAVAALRMAAPDVVLAINDMIPLWPGKIDHAVSLHPDKLPRWVAARAANPALPAGFTDVWAHRYDGPVTRTTADWSGSSGLFAVKVALVELRVGGVILAGVPMNRTKHFVRNKVWFSANAFHNGWRRHQGEIRMRTRSMGGWTMELFGPPDAQWLANLHARAPDPRLVALVAAYAIPP